MEIKVKEMDMGFEYNGYYLGQKVMYNGVETIIIGFDTNAEVNDRFIAIKYDDGELSAKESIYITHVLKGCQDELYEWVSIREIQVVLGKGIPLIKLTFDSKELQDRLEKALYHIKELNSLINEINASGVKINMNKE